MKVGFNHVGIGVADIHAGTRFYQNVLDCRVVEAPFEVRDTDDGGEQTIDVLKPPRFRRMFMAHLATADGVGIELFQLVDPPHEPRVPELEYWKSGLFHFCITDPDVAGRVERIVANGGRQLSKVWVNRPPNKEIVYCCDPWGTILEVYSHPYTEMYGMVEPR